MVFDLGYVLITLLIAVCEQPEDSGPCNGNYERWHYDNETDTCRPFRYGGCKGNKNNYPTEHACNYNCRQPGVLKGLRLVIYPRCHYLSINIFYLGYFIFNWVLENLFIFFWLMVCIFCNFLLFPFAWLLLRLHVCLLLA